MHPRSLGLCAVLPAWRERLSKQYVSLALSPTPLSLQAAPSNAFSPPTFGALFGTFRSCMRPPTLGRLACPSSLDGSASRTSARSLDPLPPPHGPSPPSISPPTRSPLMPPAKSW